MTQKLSWNQFTRPPHDSFRWRGIDGSEVLAHLPPVGTYNAELEPDELRRARGRLPRPRPQRREPDPLRPRRRRRRADAGDARVGRPGRDLRGLPLVEQSTGERFFDALEPSGATSSATIAGQLYFEYHRGTYTTPGADEARQPRRRARPARGRGGGGDRLGTRPRRVSGRRAAPRCGRCCCATSSTTSCPGTSLGEVHATAEAEQRCGRARRRRAARRGGGGAREARRRATVRRSTSTGSRAATCSRRRRAAWRCSSARVRVRRRGRACERGPNRARRRARAARQRRAGRRARPRRDACSACGSRRARGALRPGRRSSCTRTGRRRSTPGSSSPTTSRPAPSARRRSGLAVTVADPLRAEVAFDAPDRRARASSSNASVSTPARTGSSSAAGSTGASATGSSRSPSRSGSRADAATYGAQFGVHELSTHRNTDADLAHFEAPGARLRRPRRARLRGGAAVATSHGFSALDDVLRLSLLRAPTDPDPEADQGEHELVFALSPHRGDWREAGLPARPPRFGCPPIWLAGAAPGPAFAAVDSPDLIAGHDQAQRGWRGARPAAPRGPRRPRCSPVAARRPTRPQRRGRTRSRIPGRSSNATAT